MINKNVAGCLSLCLVGAIVSKLASVHRRSGIGRRRGLKSLSALGETRGVEPPKVGETCEMAIPSQASWHAHAGKKV
jgi:hypothetical protein